MGAQVRPIFLKAGEFGSGVQGAAAGALAAAGAHNLARLGESEPVSSLRLGGDSPCAGAAPVAAAGSAGIAPAGAVADAPPPCLIVNRRSFRASRGLAARAVALARSHGAQVVDVDGPAMLTSALEEVLARRQPHLMVLAGDGTVQAVIDQLSSLPAGAWMPDLLILPGGRSNLTAADLAPGGGALAMLERALLRARERRWDEAVVERSALRIGQPSAAPRFGFFLCAAAIDSGIRQCHAYRDGGKGIWRHGALSTGWWLLGLLGRALLGRTGLVCPDLSVDAGAFGRLAGPMRVLLATTLEHPSGLFNPYARRGAGGLRLTAVSRGAARFWRSLPGLLTQRFSTRMDAAHGYLSGRCGRVEIAGLSSYTLDGEKFDVDPAEPLVVTLGPRLRFLVP